MSGLPISLPGAGNGLDERDIREFLPAAIEVEQTPASPVGRLILWLIMLLFAIAVIWACLGSVDIVSTASGEVIPSGRVKVIQPLETARVGAIHVHEGQQVNAGDPLIDLDTTGTEADLRQLGDQWQDALGDALRYAAFIRWLHHRHGPLPRIEPHPGLTAEELASQNRLLSQQVATVQSRLTTLRRKSIQLKARMAMTRAQIRKQERTLPVLRERLHALDVLQKKHYGSRSKYLELEQKEIGLEQDLAIQQAQLQADQDELQTNLSRQDEYLNQQLQSALAKGNSAQSKADSLHQQVVKAGFRNHQYHLTAPITGRIQQLAVHTVGGVVKPAQPLLQVVPRDSKLEIDAKVLNRDIGFVHVGQPVEVKVNAFDFTRYGVLHGTVVNLSGDSIQDKQLGLVYKARILLKTDKLDVDGKWVRLSPGMAVQAEIKTGQRRVIEYFLSPLLRFKNNSIKER